MIRFAGRTERPQNTNHGCKINDNAKERNNGLSFAISDCEPLPRPDFSPLPPGHCGMKIVFAWEMGANLGYLSRQIPVAERLRQEGHEIAFVVRDLLVAGSMLTSRGFPFVPSPALLRTSPLAHKPINYSEVLCEHGYGHTAALRSLVHAWVHLWGALKPDVVVADHAPTACLSARVLRIPRIAWSSAFQLPPQVEPWPSIRPWESVTDESLRSADQHILRAINQVLIEFRHPVFNRVADIYGDAPALIATFPELDHYGTRADAEYVGPMLSGVEHQTMNWPGIRPRRVLAYLRCSNPGLEPLLAAMAQSEAEVICSIPDAGASLLRRLNKKHFLAFNNPINVSALLADADVMVSYGGSATLANTLLLGVPLLMAPQVVEQILGSRPVARLGAGILIDGVHRQTSYQQALSDLLTNSQYRTAARAFAKRHEDFRPEGTIARIAEVISRAPLMQGGRA